MKIVIFGAGILGRELMNKIGKDNVECFVDNNINKQGTKIDKIPVISYENLKNNLHLCKVVICASWRNVLEIADQLRNDGINYEVYLPRLLEKNPLIYYGNTKKTSEYQIKEEIQQSDNKKIARDYVDKIDIKKVCIFDSIEIETINRCNGLCSFCPVNAKKDIRKFQKMDIKLFYKIIGELEDMSFPGRVSLFSNNEPFLDDRIIELSKYAREHLKYAHIHMFTNGTLLDLNKYKEVISYLDELIIDNYSDTIELHNNIKEIYEYILDSGDNDLKNKTKILVRKQDEILTSRGGDAPNRSSYINVDGETCTLPFRQMIVRPDGKVSLCCNDPYGRETMGDSNIMTLKEIWYSENYQKLRQLIKIGREKIPHCRKCDTFM